MLLLQQTYILHAMVHEQCRHATIDDTIFSTFHT